MAGLINYGAAAPQAMPPGMSMEQMMWAWIQQQAAKDPGFLPRMAEQLQGTQMMGETTPLIDAAARGQQLQGARDSITKQLKNPADERAYGDFWENTGVRLPQVLRQQQDTANAFRAAQEDWLRKMGGKEGAQKKRMEMGNEAFDKQTAWMRPNTSVPSYMQQRALEHRQNNPQASDMGTGPGAISMEELTGAGKKAREQYGDRYQWRP